MVAIDTVLLKIAARCNLDCGYCYVYHLGDEGWRSQPKRMPLEVEVAVVEQLAELERSQDRGFSIVLHGGEPLLLGAARLAGFFSRVRNNLPERCSLHLQTNGTLLTTKIIGLCSEYGIGISISIDGPSAVHDKYRFDMRGNPSHERVAAAIRRLRTNPRHEQLFSGVLAVIDPVTNPVEVYQYLKSTGAPSIDFLYRDGNHSRLPHGKRSNGSTEYGDWMIAVMQAYLTDQNPPRIRILDDMFKLILGGAGTKEGVGLTDYGILVIETDGTINKNDTLKSAYAAADRFSRQWNVRRDRIIEVVASSEFRAYHNAQRPTSRLCQSCPELPVCGGGMLTHRWSDSNQFDNPSIFCADQKLLISRMRASITGRRSAA
jgi:uncharacterized protein